MEIHSDPAKGEHPPTYPWFHILHFAFYPLELSLDDTRPTGLIYETSTPSGLMYRLPEVGQPNVT
jgi:hypothetical protein